MSLWKTHIAKMCPQDLWGQKRAHNVCDLYLALTLRMDFMWEGIKSGDYFSTSAQINKMCSKPEPFKSSLNPESL